MLVAGGASLTISTGSASLGSYPLRVEGTAQDGTTHGVALTLRIEGATGADFTFASAQPTVAVVQGGSVPVSFTSTVTGGFSSAISLGTAFLPNGVTATFSPAAIPAPGGGTATATFAVSPTATPGTSPVTVTGTGGGIVHRASLQFTVTPLSPAPLIQNGGFEDGALAGWTRGGAVLPAAETAQAHGGAWAGQLGTVVGAEGSGDSSLSQLVALPAGSRGTLSFWVFPGTADSIGFDWQEVQLRSPAGATLATVFRQASDARTWTEVTFDVTPYLGQTVEVYFNVHQDGAGDPTFMYVDDVALTVTPGPGAGGLVRVFADDVESGSAGWTTAGSARGARWAIETTVDSHSGTHRWRSNSGGHYANNTDTALISPVLDLSDASRATLTFLRKFDIEQGFDFLNLEGSWKW
jgi:hypothetical protein